MHKLRLLALAATTTLFCGTAEAQVVINGKRLNAAEIAWLAAYSCGPVLPGNYWINMQNGRWGYAGSNRVMGHVRDRCGGQGRVFRDGNMSREGRLFYPGELLK